MNHIWNSEFQIQFQIHSLTHIDRTIKEETGFSLLQNMQGDLAYRSKIFREALAPFLARILVSELE